MERKNGQEKPGDICRKLFNFMKNRFISVIQGRTDATISTKTSPSAWEDRESQVLVPVSKKNPKTGLVVPTVLTVEHRVQDGVTTYVKPRKRSITIWGGTVEKDVKDVSSKKASAGEQGKAVQDGGTTSVKPRKRSITIWGGTEEKDAKDVSSKKTSVGEQGKAGGTEAAKDINGRSDDFIKRMKNSFDSN